MHNLDSARRSKAHLAALAFSLGILVSSSGAAAATSGANGTHDPSRMIESNGKFYVFSTGEGTKSSTDGLVWTEGPDLFPNGIPSALTSVVPSDEGVWAPDVIYLNNQYYIYYAVADTQNACAVGLVTTPTLDPSSPDYKLTDRGVVVSNPGSATYCAIDPCPLLDASGDLWLTFGSGYTKPATDNTIYLIRLDNTTGLPTAGEATPGSPLEPGHIEASYLYYHGGYYYLFWNSGGCCDGASSTYEIHMARSQTITGPYSASQIFMQSAGSVHGPGQIGIYDRCGADRFTYHYYPDTGGSVLGENELSWNSDGWPVAGAVSTTPLTPCGQPSSSGPLDAGVGNGADAGAVDAGPRDADARGTGAGTDAASGTKSGIGDGGSDDSGAPASVESGAGPSQTGSSGAPVGKDSGTTADDDGSAPPRVPDASGGSASGCGASGAPGQGLGGLALIAGLLLWVARRRKTARAENVS